MAAALIERSIDSAISSRGICYVMLTGGKTAGRLYAYWAEMSSLPFERICFLFGDERCVMPDHADSNYASVMRTFLARGVPSGCSIARMEAEHPDHEAAARAYEKQIPEEVDVLLLGMGNDGHIASLFPQSPALHQDQRYVVPAIAPNTPRERLTITPNVIAHAKTVFLLATGMEKGRVLAEAFKSPTDTVSLPVRLTMGGIWLLDVAARSQLPNHENTNV